MAKASINQPLSLFFFAGEHSGDLYGAKLIHSFLKKHPECAISAVAGPEMRKHRMSCIMPMENFQVMGFSDVVFSLPRLIKQFFFIRSYILKKKPDAVILIDYPGFSLRLAESLREKGYEGKIIQYVCPSVWAWKTNRILTMEKHLDLLICLFPFETNCFTDSSLKAHYFGHPLSEAIIEQEEKKRYLSLFPGSRAKEISKNLPIQLEAAKQILEKYPDLTLAISSANKQATKLIKSYAPDIFIFASKRRYYLMKQSALAIATSGTVTLELALHKVPTVVNFYIKPFDEWLATKVFKINLPFYCIVNLIGNRPVFPEFYGSQIKLHKLVDSALSLLDTHAAKKCLDECENIKKLLTKPSPIDNATSAVLQLI